MPRDASTTTSTPANAAGSCWPLAGRPTRRTPTPCAERASATARPNGPSPRIAACIVVSSASSDVTRGPAGAGGPDRHRANQKAAVTVGVRGPRSLRSLEAPGRRLCAPSEPQGPCLPAGPPELLLRLGREEVPAHPRTVTGFAKLRNHLCCACPPPRRRVSSTPRGPVAQRQSEGLLIPASWVRIPPGSPRSRHSPSGPGCGSQSLGRPGLRGRSGRPRAPRSRTSGRRRPASRSRDHRRRPGSRATSSDTPRKARSRAARSRTAGAFSPTPPVKTSTSRPPSAAAIAATSPRRRWW